MHACVKKAWEVQTLALPNPSVACMVLDQNYQLLSLQAHAKAHTPHAEVRALAEAFNALSPTPAPKDIDPLDKQANYDFLAQHHSDLFKECTLLVTLEPCNHFGKTPPCAALLSTIKPKRVIVGAREQNPKAMGGLKRLQEAGIEVVVLDLPACYDLLTPFKCLSSKGVFNLFKIATRLDGNYQGKISGAKSLAFSHNQRGVANTLIISGQSARTDRPLLDHRFANPLYQDRLCDVAILSRNPIIDRTLPLFGVGGRAVQLHTRVQDLPLLKGFNIIEGGWHLLESLQDHIDMLLTHTNTSLEPHQPIPHHAQAHFTPLHAQILDHDLLTWHSCGSTNP
ncbi:bifunctional diaminohydroxyphosphoribosylaminopyrimidine deaminase/5-amino-6-(5-phosphoribosylamino)uracil reductase [Helicobacter sp. L8]|uniref:bifunctional diaminohydroxyphosphoribosylaminopyrimidine deaminase/5-amino-6-(5-phosphoribosylamino)uracil reductase RibD n=1 Tax=Helicobacter sp. L8 TaxID=2316078 RepID=UPI000EB4DE76|nr:bifunctional diaminohydroxyphosphoribosylaminopyrimidine deaminase/5-amino-6-(5-phosphoribosylamino)uracil reductase [Helicobacter sp. L8]